MRIQIKAIFFAVLFSAPLTAQAALVYLTDSRNFGAGWQIVYDTDVRCGFGCSTDEIQFANYYTSFGYDIDLLGTNGFSRTAQSGGATSALSVYGVGSEFASDDFYAMQFVLNRTAFASVSPYAHENARAGGQSRVGAFFGFELTGSSLYVGSGTLRGFDDGGIYSSGSILGPGFYEAAFSTTMTLPSLTLGQQAHATATEVFSYQFRSVQVPEPATLALLGAGLLGMGLVRRKRGA